jgi:nitroreductase
LPTIPYRPLDPGTDTATAARTFSDALQQRRTVRHFAPTPVPFAVVESLVAAASSAPSGAHKQPWRFVAIENPAVKRQIRLAAEEEERAFYSRRAPQEWLDDLAPLGTDAHKPFLETAPWLVVLFKLSRTDSGGRVYYLDESVGIAAGFFIAAAHFAGLATLTHTPSPMGFLSKVLGRPDHERPFLLLPLGYPDGPPHNPAGECRVPDLKRKGLSEVLVRV